MRIGIVVLAAGESRRMGTAKQKLVFRAKSLLRHAVDEACASRAAEVFVVIGSDEMRPELEQAAVHVVFISQREQGIGTSIHSGISAAKAADLDAVILTVSDAPHLTFQTYNRLIASYIASKLPIVASQYAGTVGVPVLFERGFFDSLLALAPDAGCKGLILENGAKTVRIPCSEAETDIDTPDDYRQLIAPASNVLPQSD